MLVQLSIACIAERVGMLIGSTASADQRVIADGIKRGAVCASNGRRRAAMNTVHANAVRYTRSASNSEQAMSKQPKTFVKWAEKLATTMKLLREIKGQSMREHAGNLEMSPATLSRIERGFGCDVATLLHIHEKTGVKVETLMGLNTCD